MLEGSDLAAVTTLLGEMQERLQIREFVSDGARRRVQDALIVDALAAFRGRAAIVQEGMGASGWPWRPQPPPPVAAQAGASIVTVTVRGTVVLE